MRVKWWWGWAASGLLVVGGLVWLWLRPADVEPPRTRQYRDVTACLLTDARGVGVEPAATVWAGMQDGSVDVAAKVQFLPVAGPQTIANAASVLAGLSQGGCDVVLAVGEMPVAAVERDADRLSPMRFVLVGGGIRSGNVEIIGASRAEVRKFVASALSE